MRVLMISLDRTLFDHSSPSASRMRAYGEAAGSLTVAVPGFRSREAACGKARIEALTPWRLLLALVFPRKFDLVTAQDPFWTGAAAFLVARRCGARLEIQLHGDPWAGERPSAARIGVALWLIRRADGVRAVSERLRQRLVEAVIPDERISKTPIGLDRTEAAPRFSRPPGFETVFVFVGRLDKGKGADLLIDAFAAVQDKNRKTALLIVGDGPERASLESQARGLDLRTPIRFFGWMRDPRGVIAAADALVLPSWSEGWGRSPVEALAAGVPVIMTDVGLAGEIVRDNENGLVVPPGDAAALTGALQRFTEDPDLRARLRNGAVTNGRSFPSFGNTVAEVVAAWKKMLSRPPRQAFEPPREPSGRRAVISVFLIALAARLLMFWLIEARGTEFFYRFSDGNEYLLVARNILAGHGFSLYKEPPYIPYSYYVPGYPYFLAGLLFVGLGVRSAILFQDILGAATAAMLAAFGWRIVGRRAAILAGVLLALEPSTVLWNNQIVTETISTTLMVAGMFAVLGAVRKDRLRTAALSGILLGGATLVRHAMQYLTILIPAAAAAWSPLRLRRRLALAFVAFICALAMISPWIIRNRLTFGSWFYSTATGGVAIGKTLDFYSQVRWGKQLSDLIPYTGSGTAEKPSIERSFLWPRVLFQFLRDDPVGLLSLQLRGLVPFFLGDGYTQIRTVLSGGNLSVPEVIWDGSHSSFFLLAFSRPDVLPFIAGKTIWAAITLCAVLGLVFGWISRPKDRGAFLVFAFVIANYALGSGVGGYSRFRFPATPVILLLASLGMVTLVRRRARSEQRSNRLLVVTQAIDLDHPVLGFFHRWIEELAARFEAIEVVTLSSGRQALPLNVSVFSPRSRWKFLRNISFLWLLARSIPRACGIFFHMCPEYAIAAAPLTIPFGKKTLLWYTHRSVTWRLRLAARLVGRVFTASPESCRIRSSKVEATGHGIPIPPEARRDPSPDFRILVVGRLAPVKDIGTVIDAAALLRKRGVPATVTIVGGPVYPADEAYAAALRARVDALGLGPYTRFAGSVKHEEALAAYRETEVLVNASPNGPDKVVYEAAAAGTAVVAAHPAFKPLFGSRADDLMFPGGNAVILADRLARLAAQSHGERAKIGAELRTAVVRDHSLSKLADRIFRYFIPHHF